MRKGTFAWPKGQRIAVSVTVMLEQWSEGKPPPWGVQGTPPKPGVWFASHGEIARWVLDEKIEAETHARRLTAEAVN